ncbi:MAG: hypothetical protein WC700_08950 [Gemmatimonadaceae bacterium]|jgi:hypothetical protein
MKRADDAPFNEGPPARERRVPREIGCLDCPAKRMWTPGASYMAAPLRCPPCHRRWFKRQMNGALQRDVGALQRTGGSP